MEQVIPLLGNQDPLSLLTLMESSFDSKLCTLPRGVLSTVKYSAFLPIPTSMMSLMDSMADKSCLKMFSAVLTREQYSILEKDQYNSKMNDKVCV
jgi:hypothetical protein